MAFKAFRVQNINLWQFAAAQL